MSLIRGDPITIQLGHAVMLVGWIKTLPIHVTFKDSADKFIPTRDIEGIIRKQAI